MAGPPSASDEKPKRTRSTTPGHIRKRGKDKWQVIITDGYHVSTGKQRQKTKMVYGSRADAELVRAQMLAEAGLPTGKALTDATTGSVVSAYLAVKKGRWQPNTLKESSRMARTHLASVSDIRVEKLTRKDCQGLVKRLSRDLEPSTVKRSFGLLNSALRWAVAEGTISSNPAEHVTLPKVTSQMASPSVEQVVAFLSAAKEYDPRYHAFFLWSVTTGARRSELVGLRWEDIDLEQRTVVFSRRAQVSEVGTVVSPGLKAGDSKKLTVPVVGLGAILNAFDHREGFVFSSTDGATPWSVSGPTRVQKRVRESAGLPDLGTLHSFRHHHASQLLDAGQSVVDVSKRLGHANPSVTLAIYAHANPVKDHASAEIMENKYGGGTKGSRFEGQHSQAEPG